MVYKTCPAQLGILPRGSKFVGLRQQQQQQQQQQRYKKENSLKDLKDVCYKIH